MEHFTHCPIPTRGGRDCWDTPHPASRHGLCAHHWDAVANDWQEANPSEEDQIKAMLLAAERGKPGAPGFVYYLRFGDRVKVGYSTDVRTRVQQVPNDEVLAVEPGDFRVEKQRHAMFADALIPGQLEWFEATPDILGFAGDIRRLYGDPIEFVDRAIADAKRKVCAA